jgi:hypothetical protein
MVSGEPEAGMAANLMAPMAALVAPEVGPAPKPPAESTRYPQVLTVSAIGDASVPPIAGMVLPPLVSADAAVVSPTFRVYPAASFVLTVTVSLAMVWTPPAVGVEFKVTVPLVVKRVMTEPRLELTVVVAAPAYIGNAMTPTAATTPIAWNRLFELRSYLIYTNIPLMVSLPI